MQVGAGLQRDTYDTKCNQRDTKCDLISMWCELKFNEVVPVRLAEVSKKSPQDKNNLLFHSPPQAFGEQGFFSRLIGAHTSIVTALDAGVPLAEVARRANHLTVGSALSPRRRAERTREIRKVHKNGFDLMI